MTSNSVQFSRSVVSDPLRPHGLQHGRLPCPSLSPGVCSNSCPWSRRCRPTISSSVAHPPTSNSRSDIGFDSTGKQSLGETGYTALPLVARGGASTSPGIPPPHPTPPPAPSLGPEGAWSRLEVVARPTRRLRTEHNGRAWALGEFPFSSSSCWCWPKCVGL